MRIYLTPTGKLTCEPPAPQTTVSDLITSIMSFCEQHIDCSACQNSCCSGLIVHTDVVFARNFLAKLRQNTSSPESIELLLHVMRLNDNQHWILTQAASGKCKFLSAQGRCLIYPLRPLVCQLHTCYPCTDKLTKLKHNLYYAYREALRIEMQQITGRTSQPPADWQLNNPLLGMNSYAANLTAVLNWLADAASRA